MAELERIPNMAVARGWPDRWRAVCAAVVLAIPILWAALKGFPTHVVRPQGGYYLPLPSLPWYSFVSTWLVWGLLGGIVGFAVTPLMPFLRRRCSVIVGEDGLTVELENGTRQSISRHEVQHVDLHGHSVDFYLKSGERVRFQSESRVTDGGLFSALPESWRRGPGRVPIRSAAVAEPRGCLAAAMWLVFGIAFVTMLGWVTSLVRGMVGANVLEALRAVGWAALAGAFAAASLRLLRRRQLVIGNDGVRIVGALRDRFVPFAAIESVTTLSNHPFKRLRLYLRGGRRVHIPVVGDPEELAGRLRHALGVWQTAGDAPQLDLLARGERDARAWVEALRARADASYREAGLRIEDLEAIVDDPRAAPEQRVGAGLALARDDQGCQRVRIAASACADPDLQAALEAASEGEVAERSLRRAVQRL